MNRPSIFTKPSLPVIWISEPLHSANISDANPHIQKLQRAGKGLVLVPTVDEVEFLMKNLSHNGLHLIIYGVKDMEEAVQIERMARKLAHSEV